MTSGEGEMVLMVIFTLLVTSHAQMMSHTFTSQLNSTGGPVCATDDPSVVIPMNVRTTGGSIVMKCGAQCTSSSSCQLYQFKADLAQCELFDFQPSKFATIGECAAFAVSPLTTDKSTDVTVSRAIVLPQLQTITTVLNETLLPNDVMAIALFNDLLLATVCAIDQVYVYNGTSLQLNYTLTHSGFSRELYGLAVSSIDNCLYVADNGNNKVHRVNLMNYVITQWTVTRPRGLSVNRALNVLIATDTGKIYEYSSDGLLIRTIYDTAEYAVIYQVVELNNGSIAATRFTAGGSSIVFMVSQSGQEMESYNLGSGEPAGSAEDKFRNIYVGASANSYLLLLNSSLAYAGEFQLPSIYLTMYSIALHEKRGQLYIGGQNIFVGSCSLFVLDLVL